MTILPFLETVGEHLEQRFRIRALHALRSPEALQPSLQRERVRTDRTGHPFCWVLFRLDGRHHTKRARLRLAYVIARRARLTDEVGWCDNTAVGAILPVTDEAGAERFASDVMSRTAQRGIHPVVTVYSYPAASPPTDNLSGRKALAASPEPRRALRKPHVVERNRACQCEMSAMEPFLVQPMPWPKRLTDIVGACFGLLLTLPLFVVVAFAVRLSSPGPAFFGQRRAGLGGRTFMMYKFRSMYADAEARKDDLRHLNEQDGPAFKIKNDPRVTSIGRFLRATSIDELPQLFNVLKGDMSLVGPRPPTLDEVAKYRTWYRRRLQVAPGLTCIWQVRGRSQVSFEDWMRMDMQYIEQRSFWLDLKLILRTIPAVLLRRGAS